MSEEMLCCEIPAGALYYGEIRRRREVAFTAALREEVRSLLYEMHDLYARGRTPKVRPTKACNACSLRELCLPKLMRRSSVSAYVHRAMEEDSLPTGLLSVTICSIRVIRDIFMVVAFP